MSTTSANACGKVDGDLTETIEFIANYFQGCLAGYTPRPTFSIETQSTSEPHKPNRHITIAWCGRVVLCGEISATNDLSYLEIVAVQRVLDQSVLIDAQNQSYAFVFTRAGGPSCKFIEIGYNGQTEPLAGGSLDFFATERSSKGLLTIASFLHG